MAGHVYCKRCLPKPYLGCEHCRDTTQSQYALDSGFEAGEVHCLRLFRPETISWSRRGVDPRAVRHWKYLELKQFGQVFEPWKSEDPKMACSVLDDGECDSGFDPEWALCITPIDHRLAQHVLQLLSRRRGVSSHDS